jgi:predicted dehydrogenase
MIMNKKCSDFFSRREFLDKTSKMVASATLFGTTARSYSNIVGANDRILIGQIGCGHRGREHQKMIKLSQEAGKNVKLHSICDLWSGNLEKGAEHARKLFGFRPKTYQYSEDLLADSDLDAVMIATGDHQHVVPMIEAVKAGKDCYVEKPLANTLEEAKLARDTVVNSDRVVQMGSQWVSEPHQIKVRDTVRSGKLGKITKIEQCWNYNGPRWYDPHGPNVTTLKEEETDWKRWLAGRLWVPFDPEKYFFYRIFRQFSGGITDQWYSHGVGLVHFYLDTFIPDDTVANGGIFAWHDARENPDTMAILATFNEKEVLYSYSTSFGNSYADHTIIRGTRGTLYAVGGEGSPQWWFKPEMKSGWRSNFVFEREDITKAEAVPVLLDGETEIPPTKLSDNLREHMDNWIDCMRNRKTPNGSIETGFAHSVAVIMATRSYREGKKLYWDRYNEKILDHPVSS